jgi:hypothetical protein
MSSEDFPSAICEGCPLSALKDDREAKLAREWACGPSVEHEGYLDPRYPEVGLMGLHYGSLCRFQYLRGACELAPLGAATEPFAGEPNVAMPPV